MSSPMVHGARGWICAVPQKKHNRYRDLVIRARGCESRGITGAPEKQKGKKLNLQMDLHISAMHIAMTITNVEVTINPQKTIAGPPFPRPMLNVTITDTSTAT